MGIDRLNDSVSQQRTMEEESSSTATSFDAGGEEKVDSNKVQWTQDDPENPQNWSNRRKWVITALVSLLTINVYVLAWFNFELGCDAANFADHCATIAHSLPPLRPRPL